MNPIFTGYVHIGNGKVRENVRFHAPTAENGRLYISRREGCSDAPLIQIPPITPVEEIMIILPR